MVRAPSDGGLRSGDDVSISTYGAQMHQGLAAAERLAAKGIECAVLDLRTLKPLEDAYRPDAEKVYREVPELARF